MMDEGLLGHAVQCHGPDFLRQLQLEQQHIPPNIFLHLQKHRPEVPEINDPQYILNVRRFVSKKADMLFRPLETKGKPPKNPTDNEDSYAKMPPLETFMGIDPHTCRKHLFHSLEAKDIMIGVVTSIVESGLVLNLLCMDEGKNRDIDDLKVTAFVPVKEIPKMFPNQNPVEGYQVKDFIRGVVVSVNPETENTIISLMDRALGDEEGPKPTLGLIHEEDFPVQYRRKLHIRGLTFDELMNSILGFTNHGNVPHLLGMLQQTHDTSLMRGLHKLRVPDKEYADSLKKQQSQRLAYQNVAQGIAFFKEGRQTEAMQQLNKALQIDSNNVEALVARGALYANNESYTRALKDFEDALQVNSKHPNAIKYMHETLLAKGKVHEDEGEWDDAESCYKRALVIVPESQEAKESIRYVQYRKESGGSRSVKMKKGESPSREERRLREKSRSPRPFEKTTETLKKLIEEDKKGSKSKKKTRSQERGTSRDRSRGRMSSPRQQKRKYSSSSSSSSGSSSSSSSRSRSRDRHPRSIQVLTGKGSRSPDYHKRSKSPGYYGFHKQDEKIPGLGDSDSPTGDQIPILQYGGPEGNIQKYGREQGQQGPQYIDSKPEFAIDRGRETARHGDYDRRRESYSPNRDAPAHFHGGRDEPPRDRRGSITPTKDEVNDRLGLEDISPELYGEHDHHNDDYKFRGDDNSRNAEDRNRRDDQQRSPERHGYGSPERKRDYSRQSRSPERNRDYCRYSRSPEKKRDYFKHSRSPERTDDYSRQQSFRREDNLSPERHHESRTISITKREKKLPPENRQYEYVEGRHTFSESWSPKHDERKEKWSPKHDRKRAEEQWSPKQEPGKSRSADIYYDPGESQERRSIVIVKKDRPMAKSTKAAQEDYTTRSIALPSHERSKRSYRSSSSRSRSPTRKSKKFKGSHSRASSRSSSQSRSGSRSKYKKDERYDSTSRVNKRYNEEEVVSKQKDSPPRERQVIVAQSGKWKVYSGDGVQETDRLVQRSKFEDQEPDVNERKTVKMSDIFEDLKEPVANRDKTQIMFASYVPRSVKMKQQQPPEKSLNPESRPLSGNKSFENPSEPCSSRDRNVMEIRDQKEQDYIKMSPRSHEKGRAKDYSSDGSKDKVRSSKNDPIIGNDPRFKFRPVTPPGKKNKRKQKSSRSRSRSHDKYKKHKSRSRSRSHDKHKKYRSRSRSRSHDKHKKYRSRSRSRSHEKHKKYKSRSRSRTPGKKLGLSTYDYRIKTHHSTSSNRSRSRSHEKKTSKGHKDEPSSSKPKERRKSRFEDPTQETASVPKVKIEVAGVPSRWDSPKEKKSRWDDSIDKAALEMPLNISKAQEQISAFLNASLISKSPPPHRQMKPGEQEALNKKWKEMDESDPLVQHPLYGEIAKEKAQMLAERLLQRKAVEYASGTKKKEKKKKKLKVKGLRSKWDSDSDSGSKSSRSESRSRSRSRDKKSKSRHESVKKEGDKKSARRHSHDYKDRSMSKERSSRDSYKEDKSKVSDKYGKDGSKDLPDIVQSASKTDLMDKRVYKGTGRYDSRGGWVCNGRGRGGQKARGGYKTYSRSPKSKRSQSRSPKSKKSRTPSKASKDVKVHPPAKSKWSSGSEDSDDGSKKISDTKDGDPKGNESLIELEHFLNKLKTDKKKQTTPGKKGDDSK